jgi:CRISPR-associated protein Cas1
MARLSRIATGASSVDQLLGIEGVAAKLYFRNFAGMLREPMGFDAEGRGRRPSPDPVNATLSFLYALLLKDAAKALLTVGLDPYIGLYHALRPGRPSMALDLMEEFRPLVCDSTVLRIFNTGALKGEDFMRVGPACALKDSARKKVILAYEARMQSLARHPIFGYRASYRRILEIQARLLARTLLGEIETYPPFVTR